MNETNYDVFDIIGPTMISPSSSHTAGAVRIGNIAGQLCGYKPKEVHIYFHGSLARTYSTHKTDSAVIAGIIGLDVDDENIRRSIEIAFSSGTDIKFSTIQLHNAHPNTMIIKVKDINGIEYTVRGTSIGGGNILVEQINNYEVNINGKKDCLIGLTVFNDIDDFKKEIINISENRIDVTSFNNLEHHSSFKIIGESSIDKNLLEKIKAFSSIEEVFLIKFLMPQIAYDRTFYDSCKELVEKSMQDNCFISDTVIDFEVENSQRNKEQVFNQMRQTYYDMKESIEKGIKEESSYSKIFFTVMLQNLIST